MKKIFLLITFAAFSLPVLSQTLPVKEQAQNKKNKPVPIHVSDKLNSPEFLKTIAPLQRAQRKTVTDEVGEEKNFWVNNLETNQFESRSFKLMRKGTATQVWFEVAELNNGHLNEDVADSIFKYLEDISAPNSYDPSKGIIELSNEIFGDAPNVDGDGLVDFLVTDIRDGWTEDSNSGYTAGFFYSVDQYSELELPVGYKSNQRDILYIDSYPGIFDGEEIDPLNPLNTLAHEYQHLIHFNYNERLNKNEYTFINEGQSNFAALLSGYFPHYSIGDYLEFTNVPIFRWNRNGNTLPDYGRAASFNSYLWDRFGFQNAGRLTRSSASGATGINDVLIDLKTGLTFEDILVDWAIANLINDKINAGNPAYGFGHPFLTGLKSSDIDNAGSTFTDKKVNIQQGGISYIGLGQASDLNVTVSWTGENGEARLVTQLGSEKTVSELVNGVTFNTQSGVEYDNSFIVLVNTQASPNESTNTTTLPFTINSSGEQTFALRSDSTFSSTPKFYWSLPYYNSSEVGRLGFSNKYTAPLNGIIYALELYVVSGVGAGDVPIEVKGTGTLNISVHSDNSGQPGEQLASTSIGFDEIGSGWQRFNVKDWNLSVNQGQTLHVVYEFDVPSVDPDVNSVPLRLDNGTGNQNVSFIITAPGTYATMFTDDESNGQHGIWNKVVYGQALATGNEEQTSTPSKFSLSQNYPNPFNPSTNIEFQIPVYSTVSLSVFNSLGQKVATLVDNTLASGTHSVTWNAQNAPSGIYFYQLKAGDLVQTNKMLLLK